ncbi:MAG: hypothetical protein A3G41_07280 [Elusimicrobia bacterium RIFCSPLOWO2_12_FULL_59_9]|nr:MAG: hypothetical protein A3G41_07280 [Elusimicrobia bacterium RIFCSPLOWO2_12_FULL_59_9]
MVFGMLVLAVNLWAAPLHAGETWHRSFEKAQEASRRSAKPIFADFKAAWCYSCYYMDQHILSREDFQKEAQGLVLLELDVDREEGRLLKEKYRVQFLPSYVLLDSEGKELGRIIGEQTREQFLQKLRFLTAPARESVPKEKLRALLEAGDLDAAGRLRRSLPPQTEDSPDADFNILSARLDLSLAARKKNAEAAGAALEALLNLEKDCPLAYDVYKAQDLVLSLDAARRGPVLESARARLEDLVEKRVFGKHDDRCADLRSPVDALSDVYAGLGLKAEREALIERMLVMLKKTSAGIGSDRNHDDNLRYFLEAAGKEESLDRLYPELARAYPADYVYNYRYAKNLYDRKQAGRALEWIEKAERLCYGVNRLWVTLLKAKILDALQRRPEALRLLKRDIKAHSSRFPEESAQLQSLLDQWETSPR